MLCGSVSGLLDWVFLIPSTTNSWKSSLIFVELEEPHIFLELLHDYQRRKQNCKRLFLWSKRDRTPQSQANSSWQRHTQLLLHISKLSPNSVWLQLCPMTASTLKSDTISISVRWFGTPINICHKFSPSRGCCPTRRTLWLACGCCGGRASAAGSAWLKPIHHGKQSLNSSALAAVQEHVIKYEYLIVLGCHHL